ncbi:MAG: carboxylating nicotinate-nucleotide diphosphorylase [Bacteroidota bacterium]
MEGLAKEQIEKFIEDALYEDIRDGDHTSLACIPEDGRSKARLLVKDPGVIAGVELAEMIFKKVDPTATVDVRIEDGSDVFYGDEAFYVECGSQALLKAERLVLNTMQRMSGIATMSSRFAVEVEGLDVKILDTRKTTPLLRFLEKWAVQIGGCTNYRDGLYDWIMIKDNHIDACGTVTKAIEKVHEYFQKKGINLGITVEVRNLVELYEVLEVGKITRIMLDNFEIPILREAVATINGRFESEASGGVTLNTVRKIAETGVDFVSVGALTHSAGSLDLSLKVMKD